jgi:hypothetical protein
VFAYALLVAVVATGACVVFAFPHSAPSCDEALVPVHVPPSWSRWEVLPDMGGFRIVPRQPLRDVSRDVVDELDAMVVEDGVCPGAAPLLAAGLRDLRVRRMRGFDTFLLTSGDTAVTAFRPEPRLAFVIPPHLTLQLAGFSLAASLVIALGIARARRRLRLAAELFDPERFVEATCKEDGTLWIGESAVVVRGESAGTRRPGRVVVRVAKESGGDYRTPPTVQVADMFQGDRRQAADRQLRRASMVLSAFAAATISIAIVAGILSVNAWVNQEEAQRVAFSQRKALRDARIAALGSP